MFIKIGTRYLALANVAEINTLARTLDPNPRIGWVNASGVSISFLNDDSGNETLYLRGDDADDFRALVAESLPVLSRKPAAPAPDPAPAVVADIKAPASK